MASISSLMGSSSSSSIYGSRNSNIISGLASGLDTESMIEGMVQGYQQKILKLQQNRTSLQWKQEGYQSISDKLVEFSRKYMSYTSSTNLLSSSFFNNAVITTTSGKYADLVSATGKTSSTVLLNGVAQLATASRYSSSASGLGDVEVSGGKITVSGNTPLDLGKDMPISQLEGSLTLTYGTKNVTIDFGELEFFDESGNGTGVVTAEQLQKAIEKKLSEQNIITSSGDQVAADTLISVNVSDTGEISFSDKSSANNQVYISGATGKLKDTLNLSDAIENKKNSFTVSSGQTFTETVKTAEYLAGKTLNINLDGKSKTITLPDNLPTNNDDFVKQLNNILDNTFGSEKVVASFSAEGELSFSVKEGSTLSVSSNVGEALGIGDGLTSYVDTGKTLGSLGNFDAKTGTLTFRDAQGQPIVVTGKLMDKVPTSEWVKQKDGTYTDLSGNKLDSEGYRLSRDGERLYEFSLTVNGVKTGTFTQDTALETVINSINSNTEAGLNVSYSKLTNEFVFTAKETGEGGRIEIGSSEQGDLGAALFGVVDKSDSEHYTAGQDAIFQATVNGQKMVLTRSSNTFDIDGMSITLQGLFNNNATSDSIASNQADETLFTEGEAVSFTSKSDTDTLIEAIKAMVEDYNEIVTEVKNAYSTMPLQQSNGSKYEPLTDEDRADMSESEIAAYEEKAKTGLLFMDSDLSSLYSALRNAVTPGGSEGSLLRSIGINTSYEDGLTTISLDESALRSALETNPDQVKDIFTKSQENGAATDGLMTSIQKITDRYAATTGDVKGILIEKAGSKYSPTAALNNTILRQMEEIDEQIETWQSKMSDKVDYYTNKFTQLEVLIQQMNSQSSTLSGLMGSY